MRIAKRRSKKLKKLEEEHVYLDKKVKQLTKDRLKDRSTESKDILSRLKRTKLMVKDAIAKADAAGETRNCCYVRSNRRRVRAWHVGRAGARPAHTRPAASRPSSSSRPSRRRRRRRTASSPAGRGGGTWEGGWWSAGSSCSRNCDRIVVLGFG